MNERSPQPSENPESSHIDQEFSSASSRWFNDYKEGLLSIQHGDGSKEDKATEDYAFYQDELKTQLTDLAIPKELERKLQRDKTAEKYGPQEAVAMHVAEAMSVLGSRMSRIEELKRIDTNHPAFDKDITEAAMSQSQEARTLFLSAAEKVFSPSLINDPSQEISSIVQTFELANKADGFYAGASHWFNTLNESLAKPEELKKELAETIEEFGQQLGQRVFYSVEDHHDRSVDDEGKMRLMMAAANKILYRLVKVQEKLGQ